MKLVMLLVNYKKKSAIASTCEVGVEGQGCKRSLGRGREQVVEATTRYQCAGTASACDRGQAQRSLGLSLRKEDKIPSSLGLRQTHVVQRWWKVKGGLGCDLNHDRQVGFNPAFNIAATRCWWRGGKLAIIYGRAHGYFETLGHADY